MASSQFVDNTQVCELVLDNCQVENGAVTGLTAAFTNLQFLSLINSGINTLKGFPALESLKKVCL